MQTNWWWCSACQGLFFAGRSAGVCPAGGKGHNPAGSGRYALFNEVPSAPGQHGWRYCSACQGLFFGESSTGVCPAREGGHDPSGSGDYALVNDVPGSLGQHDWRWCSACQGLFFGGGSGGRCPARSGGHDASGSGDYSVALALEGAPERPTGPCRYEPGESNAAKSSPGSVAALFPGPRTLESALLYDFAVAGHTPKAAHDDYLRRIIADNSLADPKSDVRVALMEGFTDCVSNERINSPIRSRRAEAVASRLVSLGAHVNNLAEYRAATSGDMPGDDVGRVGRARNRSVTVLLQERVARKPPPPRVPGLTLCRGSKEFGIRLLGSATAGKQGPPGPAAGVLQFEIIDYQCGRAQRFVLAAGGASAGTAVSTAGPSDEKFFTTSEPVLFPDFEGPGLWESGQTFGGPSADGLAIPHVIRYWFSWGGPGAIGAGVGFYLGKVSRVGKEHRWGLNSRPHDPKR